MRLAGSLLLALLFLTAGALLFAQAPEKNAMGQKQSSGSPPTQADIAKGNKLFSANCAVCHYRASSAKKIGPGLRGFSRRGRYTDGKPVDDASVRAWIEKGGKDMPGFKDTLNAEQVRELVAYLKTL